jgi:hypothetical protein
VLNHRFHSKIGLLSNLLRIQFSEDFLNESLPIQNLIYIDENRFYKANDNK